MVVILVSVLQQPKTTDQSALAVLRRRFRTFEQFHGPVGQILVDIIESIILHLGLLQVKYIFIY